MAGPATINDLKDRSFRPLTDQEQAVGATLLEDAWNLIQSSAPSAAERISTDITYMAIVKQVQCAMVLRVVNNPEGLLSEQVDDYQYRRDAAVSAGVLYLSPEESAILAAGGKTLNGAWTIRSHSDPRRGYWLHPDQWVPLP